MNTPENGPSNNPPGGGVAAPAAGELLAFGSRAPASTRDVVVP